jgi:hypothetical protein
MAPYRSAAPRLTFAPGISAAALPMSATVLRVFGERCATTRNLPLTGATRFLLEFQAEHWPVGHYPRRGMASARLHRY